MSGRKFKDRRNSGLPSSSVLKMPLSNNHSISEATVASYRNLIRFYVEALEKPGDVTGEAARNQLSMESICTLRAWNQRVNALEARGKRLVDNAILRTDLFNIMQDPECGSFMGIKGLPNIRRMTKPSLRIA
jgi:hypothetical protein